MVEIIYRDNRHYVNYFKVLNGTYGKIGSNIRGMRDLY